MNKRARSKNNINTQQVNKLLADPVNMQIVEALTHEELSLQEMTELLHEDKKKISRDITLLENAHVIVRHFHNHRATYALLVPQLAQTVHILYGLWIDSVAAPQNYAEVRI